MPSRTLDAEIDRLYQLPLEEFTAARNALAKTAGADAARVRALAKPPVAAWAVNQLRWRKRDVWDALIEAAENARRVNRAALAGRAGDVRAATEVHNHAVDDALRETLTLLADAAPATDATRHAIATTLRALPADEPPGRLTRVLQPAGFEALSGLTIARGVAPRPSTRPPGREPAPAREKDEPTVDVKALTRARQAAVSASRVRRDAEQTLERARFELARSERERQRAREALAEAQQTLTRATQAHETAIKRAREADQALSAARVRADETASDVKSLEPASKRR